MVDEFDGLGGRSNELNTYGCARIKHRHCAALFRKLKLNHSIQLEYPVTLDSQNPDTAVSLSKSINLNRSEDRLIAEVQCTRTACSSRERGNRGTT